VDQNDLIGRARAALVEDARVLGIWLAGSYGRGDNDRFSDVDLWVVVAPHDVDHFCADWPQLSERIAPTVLRQQVGRYPVFSHVTADWLRYDLSVGTPDDMAERTVSTVRPIYDPRGLSAALRPPALSLRPDADTVQMLTREFLRVLGLLPVVIGREELVVGQSGAGLLRTALIRLMLEDAAVEDRGGALRLKPVLRSEHLQALHDLPGVEATRSSVIQAHLACARSFLPLARRLHRDCEVPWPDALEEAARRHLRSTLAIVV